MVSVYRKRTKTILRIDFLVLKTLQKRDGFTRNKTCQTNAFFTPDSGQAFDSMVKHNTLEWQKSTTNLIFIVFSTGIGHSVRTIHNFSTLSGISIGLLLGTSRLHLRLFGFITRYLRFRSTYRCTGHLLGLLPSRTFLTPERRKRVSSVSRIFQNLDRYR